MKQQVQQLQQQQLQQLQQQRQVDNILQLIIQLNNNVFFILLKLVVLPKLR